MPAQNEPTVNPSNDKRPRGIPLWTALVALLILAVVVIGGLGYFVWQLGSSKAKLARQLQQVEEQQKKSEIAQKKASEEAKLLLAQNEQEKLHAEIRAATNALGSLLAEGEKLRGEAAELRTNATGKALAPHADLLTLARRFYESGLPSLSARDEVAVRLESARRIELQLLPNLGTPYVPPQELHVTVQNATAWGEQGNSRLLKLKEELSYLVGEAKARVAPPTSNSQPATLEAAIVRLNTSDADARLRAREETAAAANTAAEVERAKAAAEKILADAKQQADAIRAKIRDEEAKSELDLKEREAALKLAETKTKVSVQTKENEAKNAVLRQKASDPNVQAEISPFITPGYLQVRTTGVEKKPFSYSELKTYGALNPDLAGLSKLVRLAAHPSDKVRPRWEMNFKLFQRVPSELEKAKSAQALLIELGPVLVEMGLLQP